MLLNLVEEKTKEALRARDETTVSVLRLLKAALVNERIAKMHDLSEEEELQVVKREVKKREESAALYRQGGSVERAETETKEAAYLKAFLPAEMSDDDLRALISASLQKQNLTPPVNFGQAMGQVMKEVAGQASGDRVSKILKEELAK